LSSAHSIELMSHAKRRSAKISCGVSINNLSLNENDVGGYRTFFKLSPPLRSEDDRQALIAGLNDGTIDVIHSDHDPQDSEVKRQPFAEASDGAIDLDYPWQARENDFRSRSHNSSFEGARLAGKVMATYVAGEKVFTHAEGEGA